MISITCEIMPDRVCRFLAGLSTRSAGFWRVHRRDLPVFGGSSVDERRIVANLQRLKQSSFLIGGRFLRRGLPVFGGLYREASSGCDGVCRFLAGDIATTRHSDRDGVCRFLAGCQNRGETIATGSAGFWRVIRVGGRVSESARFGIAREGVEEVGGGFDGGGGGVPLALLSVLGQSFADRGPEGLVGV